MAQKNDFELIEKFRNGNIQGFNELVEKYKEKVYWIARRLTGTHEDADDIVQEVFTRVYKGLKNFRGDSNFYTWLYRITINNSLNTIRKNKLRDIIPYDKIMEEILPGDLSTDTPVLQQEYQTLLERAVDRLPAKQRVVFMMRYHDELPFEEMAKQLHKSVGGTKANYFHAVKKVTEYVRREINR